MTAHTKTLDQTTQFYLNGQQIDKVRAQAIIAQTMYENGFGDTEGECIREAAEQMKTLCRRDDIGEDARDRLSAYVGDLEIIA